MVLGRRYFHNNVERQQSSQGGLVTQISRELAAQFDKDIGAAFKKVFGDGIPVISLPTTPTHSEIEKRLREQILAEVEAAK